jgi:hypothetical protein
METMLKSRLENVVRKCTLGNGLEPHFMKDVSGDVISCGGTTALLL